MRAKEKNNFIKIITLENAGHGTRMLSASPTLAERIIDWLAK